MLTNFLTSLLISTAFAGDHADHKSDVYKKCPKLHEKTVVATRIGKVDVDYKGGGQLAVPTDNPTKVAHLSSHTLWQYSKEEQTSEKVLTALDNSTEHDGKLICNYGKDSDGELRAVAVAFEVNPTDRPLAEAFPVDDSSEVGIMGETPKHNPYLKN